MESTDTINEPHAGHTAQRVVSALHLFRVRSFELDVEVLAGDYEDAVFKAFQRGCGQESLGRFVEIEMIDEQKTCWTRKGKVVNRHRENTKFALTEWYVVDPERA